MTAFKIALKDELVRALAADLETLERAQAAAMEGATHEEAKPENDKDTRALEQSYLARGQAKRVEELRAALAAVQLMRIEKLPADSVIGNGALVTAEDGERTAKFFIAAHGGGARLAKDTVQVVTPRSPLGEALVGKQAGDSCEVVVGGRKRELEILTVE